MKECQATEFNTAPLTGSLSASHTATKPKHRRLRVHQGTQLLRTNAAERLSAVALRDCRVRIEWDMKFSSGTGTPS